METINNYLNTMFASLPSTNQMEKLKNDILSNMEDKYNELKRNGKSENEAIGIVISEFGNIDELVSELGIGKDTNETYETSLPVVTMEEANDFINTHKNATKLIGIGVFLCMLAPASLILLTQLNEDGFFGNISEDMGNILSLIPLLIFIAIGVGLFIYSDMKTQKYKYIENDFELPSTVKVTLQQMYDGYLPKYTTSVIIGVVMCIIAPVTLFITSAFDESFSVYGVSFLLFFIGIAVFIFIYYGSRKESLSKLLKINDFSRKKNEENRVIGAVASIIWPLAVVSFLVSGWVFDQWHINWIIFPITGILFGMFSATYSILKGENSKNR